MELDSQSSMLAPGSHSQSAIGHRDGIGASTPVAGEVEGDKAKSGPAYTLQQPVPEVLIGQATDFADGELDAREIAVEADPPL